MNNELLLSLKKHTDTLFEQAKTIPQKSLEFGIKKQMETFSFSPPTNLVEGGKWLLAISSLETTNSVFHKTDEK